MPHSNLDEILRRTHLWLREAVVGEGLCPFAREPVQAGRLRVAVSEATRPEALVLDLARELEKLGKSAESELETTLLVHPDCLRVFEEYNQFLDLADAVLIELGQEGVIQIASFHPDYQFEGVDPDGPENYTNRSPYPMLHLLRESSVTRAVEGMSDPASIPARNQQLLRTLPRETLERWRRGES